MNVMCSYTAPSMPPTTTAATFYSASINNRLNTPRPPAAAVAPLSHFVTLKGTPRSLAAHSLPYFLLLSPHTDLRLSSSGLNENQCILKDCEAEGGREGGRLKSDPDSRWRCHTDFFMTPPLITVSKQGFCDPTYVEPLQSKLWPKPSTSPSLATPVQQRPSISNV